MRGSVETASWDGYEEEDEDVPIVPTKVRQSSKPAKSLPKWQPGDLNNPYLCDTDTSGDDIDLDGPTVVLWPPRSSAKSSRLSASGKSQAAASPTEARTSRATLSPRGSRVSKSPRVSRISKASSRASRASRASRKSRASRRQTLEEDPFCCVPSDASVLSLKSEYSSNEADDVAKPVPVALAGAQRIMFDSEPLDFNHDVARDSVTCGNYWDVFSREPDDDYRSTAEQLRMRRNSDLEQWDVTMSPSFFDLRRRSDLTDRIAALHEGLPRKVRVASVSVGAECESDSEGVETKGYQTYAQALLHRLKDDLGCLQSAEETQQPVVRMDRRLTEQTHYRQSAHRPSERQAQTHGRQEITGSQGLSDEEEDADSVDAFLEPLSPPLRNNSQSARQTPEHPDIPPSSLDVGQVRGSAGNASDIGLVRGSAGCASDLGQVRGSAGNASDVGRARGSAGCASDLGQVRGSAGGVSDMGKLRGSAGGASDVGRARGSTGSASDVGQVRGSAGGTSDVGQVRGSAGSASNVGLGSADSASNFGQVRGSGLHEVDSAGEDLEEECGSEVSVDRVWCQSEPPAVPMLGKRDSCRSPKSLDASLSSIRMSLTAGRPRVPRDVPAVSSSPVALHPSTKPSSDPSDELESLFQRVTPSASSACRDEFSCSRLSRHSPKIDQARVLLHDVVRANSSSLGGNRQLEPTGVRDPFGIREKREILPETRQVKSPRMDEARELLDGILERKQPDRAGASPSSSRYSPALQPGQRDPSTAQAPASTVNRPDVRVHSAEQALSSTREVLQRSPRMEESWKMLDDLLRTLPNRRDVRAPSERQSTRLVEASERQSTQTVTSAVALPVQQEIPRPYAGQRAINRDSGHLGKPRAKPPGPSAPALTGSLSTSAQPMHLVSHASRQPHGRCLDASEVFRGLAK